MELDEKKLKQIGKRIEELRKKAGYTSYENFAVDNDLQRMTVFRAEKGYNMNLNTLIVIIKKLGISMEDFFKGL